MWVRDINPIQSVHCRVRAEYRNGISVRASLLSRYLYRQRLTLIPGISAQAYFAWRIWNFHEYGAGSRLRSGGGRERRGQRTTACVMVRHENVPKERG